jgi:surface polysaccharide O-acyltransferase-like enzyme
MTDPVSQSHSRVLYADILRIAATFAIVILHTATSEWYGTPVHSTYWFGLNFYNTLVRWGVPVFVMLSGAFFLNPELSRPPEKIFKKYIPRIATALLFWGILYGCIQTASSPQSNTMDYLRAPLNLLFLLPVHLWFLYVIMGLYILTPLLRILTRYANKKDLEYFIVLFIIFGTFLPLLSHYFLKTIHQPLYRNLIIPGFTSFIGYFVAGYYFQHYALKRTTRIIFYFLGILSWILVFAGSTQFSLEKNIPDEYLLGNFRPTTFSMAIAVFLFVKENIGNIRFSVQDSGKAGRETRTLVLQRLVNVIFCTSGSKNEWEKSEQSG